LVNSDQDPDRYETIIIESKIRQGIFHKVIKDLESGKAISCSVNVGVRETSNVQP
jgi:hypothetical protein